MRKFPILIVFIFAASVFAAPLNLTGTVKNGSGQSVDNAVVLLKVGDGLIAYARTLSGSNGNFVLLPGKEAPTTPIAKAGALLPAKFASYQAMDLKGRTHSPGNLPQGIYVLLGKAENGKSVNLGTVYHKGGALKTGEITQKEQKARTLAKLTAASGEEFHFIVRKAGYLPKEVEINSFEEDVGTVVLERDPLEDRIDSVMNMMSTADKIAQMTQPEASASGPYTHTNNSLFGSALDGGDAYQSNFLTGMASNVNNRTGVKIPVTYGKDAVHGNAGVSGYTVFPHNIGLGASRDSALVREIGEATAKELWAARIDLNFSPAISVAQDARWGRTYESYGETAELSVQMGAAMVRGLQGERYDAPWRIIATAKHYLADGGTVYGTGVSREGAGRGMDRGNVTANDETIRTVHLPGYEAVIEQGVLSIMASFNQIGGTHQHVDRQRLTGLLKDTLGFDGYIISDWLGIGNSEMPGTSSGYSGFLASTSQSAIKNAINAGIDLAMEPGTHASFITGLTNLVNSNEVSMTRIEDAVHRILRAKFRAGRMDNISGPAGYAGNSSNVYSNEHKELARKAVKKSLVLLKNDNSVLPLSKNAAIHVFGTHYDNIGYQCGGWTIKWQGVSGNSNFSKGTSIYKGMQQVAPAATLTQSASGGATNADIIVHVIGEEPYAEWEGDISSLNWTPSTQAQLSTYRSQGKKIVTVLVTGRPRILPAAIVEASDAIIAAWLPGTEGGGVADVLFGDYLPTGKLPIAWPGTPSYPYGHGLTITPRP